MNTEQMRKAALAWLDSAGDVPSARLAFAGDDRFVWHYTPVPRRGFAIGSMTPVQKGAALALLETGLSETGLETANAIMAHELVLGEIERDEIGHERFPRDPGLYFFTVFGDPAGDSPWGWRVDGHHLSLHFTVVDGELRSEPSFFGANPAKAPDGTRILAPMEDLARSLVAALGDDAIIAEDAPGDILTTNRPAVEMLDPDGVCSNDFNGAQRDGLSALIDAHLSRLRERPAIDLRDVWFCWAGPTDVGAPHYYRVQGAQWMIEYDNVQNGANHIHAVYRDVRRDFGRDLLGQHHRDAH